MKRPPPYIETCFSVSGHELNPDELTALLAIQPTKSSRLPLTPLLGTQGQTLAEPFWQIDIARDSYSTDEGINEIFELLWGRSEAFAGYLKDRPSVRVSFLLKVKIIYYRPVYEISIESLRKLAIIGCDFKITEVCDLRSSNVYDLDEYEEGR